MMACATCTPLGPNSLANDWASALMANLPVANDEHKADPFMAAVADVKMRVGGYSPDVPSRSRGSAACAKWKAPLLRGAFRSAWVELKGEGVVVTHWLPFPP